MTALSLPSGGAPGKSDGWPCGFDPFVAIANPKTTHAVHEKKNLAWVAKSATGSQ